MKAPAITLSLCIPTLNRGAVIGETLESIIGQATEAVEIVVVDGASTDNTEDVVREYQRRFPRLRYVRRAGNMGVERDTDKAVELAQGEYCWLMCSDDVLRPGAIAAVLGAIQGGYELVIVNAEVRNVDLSQVLEPAKLQFPEDRVYGPEELERLFVETADYLSYMGAVVIRKALWDSRSKDGYLDTDFLHVGVIFQRPIPERAMVLATPWISIRYGNATWTPREFELWAVNWPKVVWSFPHFPESVKRGICVREGWLDIRRMIVQRACGTFSTREYDRWIRPGPGPRLGKLVVRAISLLPVRVLNLLTVAYFARRSDRRATLLALRQSRVAGGLVKR